MDEPVYGIPGVFKDFHQTIPLKKDARNFQIHLETPVRTTLGEELDNLHQRILENNDYDDRYIYPYVQLSCSSFDFSNSNLNAFQKAFHGYSNMVNYEQTSTNNMNLSNYPVQKLDTLEFGNILFNQITENYKEKYSVDECRKRIELRMNDHYDQNGMYSMDEIVYIFHDDTTVVELCKLKIEPYEPIKVSDYKFNSYKPGCPSGKKLNHMNLVT